MHPKRAERIKPGASPVQWMILVIVLIATSIAAFHPCLDSGLFGDSLAFVDSANRQGIRSLIPMVEWTPDQAESYWVHQSKLDTMLGATSGIGEPQQEQYMPPAAQLLMVLQTRVFGGWLPGYHLVSLLLHLLTALLLVRLTLALGAGFLQSALTGLVYTVHPTVSSTVILVSGQPYLLSALFFLGAWLTALKLDENQGSQRLLVLCAAIALLSDAGAWVLLPAIYFSRSVESAGISDRSDKMDQLSWKRGPLYPVLVTAGLFLAFRMLMPMDSGSHSLEGWYQNQLIAVILEPVSGWLQNPTYSWFAVLPPQAAIFAPLVYSLGGFAALLMVFGTVYLAFKRPTLIIRSGLVVCIAAILGDFNRDSSLTGTLIPNLTLALISVDLLRRMARGWGGKIILALALLYFLPAAVLQNHGVQDFTSSYSKTAQDQAARLADTLGVLPEGGRVYILNAWSVDPMITRRLALILDRPDLRVQILSMHPSLVPAGLAVEENPWSRWMVEQAAVRYNESDLQLQSLDPHSLRVALKKGALLKSIADIDLGGGFIQLPVDRELEFDDFSVKLSRQREDAVSAFTFRFKHDLLAPMVRFAVLKNGDWRIFEP